ncbi:MAG: signal peptidase I [Chloroflexi bacterium]|nr:signal peptidase I [Chloroflexota bacterium]
MKSFLRDILVTFVLAAVIYLGLRTTIQTFSVNGPSMEPNFYYGQRLVVNKIAYKVSNPQRGDVIVFHSLNGRPGDYIKRVIGLPGESVEIRDGKVYIHKVDGSVITLTEPYIKEPVRGTFKGQKIPEDHYFVMGDNRNNSGDSRESWTLPREDIVGRAWVTVWPPDRMGPAPNYHFQPL